MRPKTVAVLCVVASLVSVAAAWGLNHRFDRRMSFHQDLVAARKIALEQTPPDIEAARCWQALLDDEKRLAPPLPTTLSAEVQKSCDDLVTRQIAEVVSVLSRLPTLPMAALPSVGGSGDPGH